MERHDHDVTNKNPPAKPGVFIMRAKPYVNSLRVTSESPEKIV